MARTVHLHRHQPAQGRQIRCRTAADAGASWLYRGARAAMSRRLRLEAL